jgi:phosphatidate cytidylyltransferase
MSNLTQRLLLFFIGVPLIVAIMLGLPQARHGAIVLVILVFTGGCAYELSRLFKQSELGANSLLFVALGLALPIVSYVGCLVSGEGGPLPVAGILTFAAGLLAVVTFAPFAFGSVKSIPQALLGASAYSLCMVYPGLLGAFIVLIAAEPRYAGESVLTFALMAIGNDSLAWLAGVTLGRRRGILAVSPNKSVAGFVGGMIGSLIIVYAAAAVFPQALHAPWYVLAGLALADGAAVIFGDLFESALKRSAGLKDSGKSIPGRGGFLDTFDSLLFSAPVFYGLTAILGLFR